MEDALEALKAWLRIETAQEDAMLAGLIGAASELCERFTGQWLVARAGEEILPACADWRPLAARPVRAITAVVGVPAEGAEFVLPADAYAIDIDGAGTGWVRVMRPGAAGRVKVRFQAGMAEEWAGLPEALRHGVIRTAGDQHMRREGAMEVGLGQVGATASVLWRPWRRVRLS